ncbi:unnamed protein product [Nippostrongylus brasiliensis]|uniref:Phlebovirus_G2 domain-containing protein n=1 Tax=Nippostrongylus brasiliensis TaxID=27835 RepID=A0A0N4YI68_NIPBR|nr:unnamed protein product [Nippostrongylus brasiliensis]
MTALWTSEELPYLQCPTQESAKSLQCNFFHSCHCSPAENQVRCDCKDQEIEKNFRKVENILPVTLPYIKFTSHPDFEVMAHIDQGVSAEVVVNMKELVDDVQIVTSEEICEISDSNIYGCYRCNRGAQATVSCSSTTTKIMAEVDCGVETFSVPCSPSHEESTLHFMLSSARIQLNCSVTCGTKPTHFEITGILKYVHSIEDRMRQVNVPQHNITSDFEWPDISHILEVYWQWYKIVVATVVAVGLALLISYLYLTTACNQMLYCAGNILVTIVGSTSRFFWYMVSSPIKKLCKHRAPSEKVATKTL